MFISLLCAGCSARLLLPPPEVTYVPHFKAASASVDLSTINASFYDSDRVFQYGADELWAVVGHTSGPNYVVKFRSDGAAGLTPVSNYSEGNMCCWSSQMEVFDGYLYDLGWINTFYRYSIDASGGLALHAAHPGYIPSTNVLMDFWVTGNLAIFTTTDTANTFLTVDISNFAAASVLFASTDVTAQQSAILGIQAGRYLILKSQTANKISSWDISNPSSPVLVSSLDTDNDSHQRVLDARAGFLTGNFAVTLNYTAGTVQSFAISADGHLAAGSRLLLSTHSSPHAAHLVHDGYFAVLTSTPFTATMVGIDADGVLNEVNSVTLPSVPTDYGDLACLYDAKVCLATSGLNSPLMQVVPLDLVPGG